jgi:plasmid replication initiation protein
MNLSKRNYSKQSHVIVNARYALTRNEIDLILTLLTEIKKEDKDFKDYIFSIKDLEVKTSKKWQSKQLRETVKGLMSKPLEIEEKPNSWEIINWFSYFKYDNGAITCRFDKRLKPYLLEIKNRFVISDLRMILPMRSSYSKRVYLLLKEYAKIGSRTIELSELQEILKVPKSLKRYDNFKAKVLIKSKNDINKFTDLKIDFKEKKLGKKVTSIIFTIKKNDEDLKTFIQVIRELYTNQRLAFYNDKPIKCDDKGLLYYADESMATLTKKEAQKAWEWLHEHRASLEIFQQSLF